MTRDQMVVYAACGWVVVGAGLVKVAWAALHARLHDRLNWHWWKTAWLPETHRRIAWGRRACHVCYRRDRWNPESETWEAE